MVHRCKIRRTFLNFIYLRQLWIWLMLNSSKRQLCNHRVSFVVTTWWSSQHLSSFWSSKFQRKPSFLHFISSDHKSWSKFTVGLQECFILGERSWTTGDYLGISIWTSWRPHRSWKSGWMPEHIPFTELEIWSDDGGCWSRSGKRT